MKGVRMKVKKFKLAEIDDGQIIYHNIEIPETSPYQKNIGWW